MRSISISVGRATEPMLTFSIEMSRWTSVAKICAALESPSNIFSNVWAVPSMFSFISILIVSPKAFVKLLTSSPLILFDRTGNYK